MRLRRLPKKSPSGFILTGNPPEGVAEDSNGRRVAALQSSHKYPQADNNFKQ